ncbi:DsrE/DsrF/DrsH-like family protein [Aminicella lysinilytica]|uniref:NADPH-dependent 2,4-dienoyl-CoA reductase/sulfur reductase-like enzyme n=1 Tax=Aminicella lysinilytica TaxID=433323 RepID=A0A4R6QA42_9FIRM|nr:DsrE/DsrF/DrsH-like family protein [Aminicella lysinilytica]TDP59075.1 NADPH-dependent 2,4-dienoyl-CoA reductase/sulfur reductase-like enzyme [Aminicella lysinilytica]
MSKTVIIGGVAGGATAAARLRRLDESMEIVILERGEYISYANCGLPYYIGDVIKERQALLLQTPMAMKAKYNIDVRTSNEVEKINKDRKTVTVRSEQGEYEETYDDLIIATGSSPLKPPIPGIDNEGIYSLWTVPDTDRIRAIVDERKPKTAAVIGGGFIGLEMAENLHKRGIKVSIIEAQDQVMAPVDYDMAQLIHENLDMNGVSLHLGDGVSEFIRGDDMVTVKLASGAEVTADMVILSIGVRPNSQLAKDAGLQLNKRGGIKVDPWMHAFEEGEGNNQADGIWAVGDVIEVENFITKEKTMIPLAGPANKQGRIVANNIKGAAEEYKGSLGTSVAQVFDYTVASTGINEKTLRLAGKEKGRDYEVALIVQKSHAGYYPMATPMTLKMLFDMTGKILGAQIIGQDGVDKRIDTIATTIRLGGDVHSLAELELAYAPPYSSAKDPVNMLGFVAGNILDGKMSFVQWDEIKKEMQVLDVTEDVERRIWAMDDSVHIPLGQLRERLDELDKNKTIVVYCAIGVRSYNGARVLAQCGFKDVQILAGGSSFYKSMTYVPCAGDSQKDEGNVEDMNESGEIKILDCCGLQCPGPIMKVNDALKIMKPGETVRVSATDMGFAKDVESWCQRTGNTFVGKERNGRENIVTIRKGNNSVGSPCCPSSEKPAELPQGKTMIVFDGDLDKVLASFIIANGAAAMGRPVTMFFTFWGLNVLRKPEKVKVKKTMIEKMFGAMMPRGTGKLKLSNMNMMGMGTKMMKKVMKAKNVMSLEELIEEAKKNGVKLVACTMSMDIMGITADELIDGVELAGVASYLGDAEVSNVNLFI